MTDNKSLGNIFTHMLIELEKDLPEESTARHLLYSHRVKIREAFDGAAKTIRRAVIDECIQAIKNDFHWILPMFATGGRQMDRDKLKEKIRQAISSEHSCKNNLCDLSDKRSYDRCICESDANAALSAIEEAGYVINEQKWQPIDTAPMDGTEVLIRGTAYSMLVPKPITAVAHWSRGWWGNHKGAPPYTRVTHWRPLPSPPETSDA